MLIWDADKLTKLGATSVLHFVGDELMMGRATTVQLIASLSAVEWGDGIAIARNLNTAPARAAGRKRVETFRVFYQQAAREFSGDDLL